MSGGAPGGAGGVLRARGLAVAIGILALALGGVSAYLYMLLRGQDPTSGSGGSPYRVVEERVLTGPNEGVQPLFDKPMGVAFDAEGRIYVSDAGNNRICVFSSGGKLVRTFGRFGVAKPLPGGRRSWAPGCLNYPLGIDVGDDGRIYVADFHNDCIEVFDPEGRFVRRFPDPDKPVGRGSSGQSGKGIAVTDVAVRGGKVFATDAYQVVVFTTEGRFVEQFGKPGDAASDIDHPNGIDVGENGTVYVSDSNHNRVTAFALGGRAVWNVGQQIPFDRPVGSSGLSLPRGLAVRSDGTLIVADALASELVVISDDGRILARLAGPEQGEVFSYPNGVDARGSTSLAVAEKVAGRVRILRITAR